MKKPSRLEYGWVKIADSAEGGFTTYRMQVAYGYLYLVRAGNGTAMTFVKDSDAGPVDQK